MSVITLIGYRASGKSAIAPLLAEQLGWNWIDADAELQSRCGISIQQMFTQHGETWFREQERVLLAELLGRNQLVIAAGGGAILNEQTKTAARKAGPIVWLKANPETIIQRIHDDEKSVSQRPALTNLTAEAEVRAMLKQREPVYQASADIIVSVEELTPEEITTAIHNKLTAELRNSTPDRKETP